MPTLRPYTPADAERVHALNDANTPEVGAVSLDRLAWLADHAAHVEVVDDGGDIVGFLIGFAEGSDYDSPNYRWFSQRHERFSYVDRIAVADGYRGAGLGPSLYRSFEAHAVGRGSAVLCAEVNTVPPNERSLRFHRLFGFEVVAELEPWPDTEPGHLVAMVEKRL